MKTNEVQTNAGIWVKLNNINLCIRKHLEQIILGMFPFEGVFGVDRCENRMQKNGC